MTLARWIDGSRIQCGCGSPITQADECPGCGKTREQLVNEAGALPDDVLDQMAAAVERAEHERAEMAALGFPRPGQ